MVVTNASSVEKEPDGSWTATLQRWSSESDDLALPIPLNIQKEWGLTENSVAIATFVDGKLVITEVDAKTSFYDIETLDKD